MPYAWETWARENVGKMPEPEAEPREQVFETRRCECCEKEYEPMVLTQKWCSPNCRSKMGMRKLRAKRKEERNETIDPD